MSGRIKINNVQCIMVSVNGSFGIDQVHTLHTREALRVKNRKERGKEQCAGG